MRNSLKIAGTFLLATLLFTSCKDCDTTVTQVTQEDAQWLVYSRGDSARFINENNARVSFVNTSLLSEQVPGEGFNVSDKCIERFDVQAYSSIEDPAKNYPGLATYILKRPNDLQVRLIVQERLDLEIDETQPTLPTAAVNNTIYTDVFEVVRTDSSNVRNLKRLLYNKEFGFLSVEYYDGRRLERIRE